MGVPPIPEFLTLLVLPGEVPGASMAVEGGRCRRCFGGGWKTLYRAPLKVNVFSLLSMARCSAAVYAFRNWYVSPSG